jgi:ferredoxin
MRVHVEREKCIAAGMCAMTAPSVFDQDEEDGTVIVLNDSPSAENAEVVHEAVSLCPAQVISVREQ